MILPMPRSELVPALTAAALFATALAVAIVLLWIADGAPCWDAFAN